MLSSGKISQRPFYKTVKIFLKENNKFNQKNTKNRKKREKINLFLNFTP